MSRGDVHAQLGGRDWLVRYHGPNDVRQAFAPWFRLVSRSRHRCVRSTECGPAGNFEVPWRLCARWRISTESCRVRLRRLAITSCTNSYEHATSHDPLRESSRDAAENRRFPLPSHAVGAALPRRFHWTIVDGNRPDADPLGEVSTRSTGRRAQSIRCALDRHDGDARAAARECGSVPKAVKSRYPIVPIVWGGNFRQPYPAPVLNATYVDWLCAGRARTRSSSCSMCCAEPRSAQWPAFRSATPTAATVWRRAKSGRARTSLPRSAVPQDRRRRLPAPDVPRAGVRRVSGVDRLSVRLQVLRGDLAVSAAAREQAPARTVEHLSFLVREHGMDSVHFYDNNFFRARKTTRASSPSASIR